MKNKLFIVSSVSLIIFSCTATPKLALTEGWNNPQQVEVAGKKKFLSKQTMSIGDVRSTYVKRSWTKSSTKRSGFGFGINNSEWSSMIGTEYISKRQSLHFQMADEFKNTSDVYCLANVKRNDLIVGRKSGVINTIFDIAGIGDSESDLYAVQLLVNDIPQPFELLLDNIASQKSPAKYAGMIVQGAETKYTISSTNKLVGKNGKTVSIPFGSVGFEIKDYKGRPVAAINIMGKPTVYFNNISGLDKFVVSNLCAAILLREEINN